MLMVRHNSKFYLVNENLRSILTGHVFLAELRAAMSSETGLYLTFILSFKPFKNHDHPNFHLARF